MSTTFPVMEVWCFFVCGKGMPILKVLNSIIIIASIIFFENYGGQILENG